ncbi:hypothetical protein CAPN008_05990 [Capnocytophaga canis]|uniref:hypothetical protein n=1 Tax=Capnocytophaga canis TaxID=1848903 RepID=UPI001ACF6004|nr:hypothetical protein [Capnocytophaga canis]GIM60549.1 hypothetical protein CAPN008_05990 [Capnocytophaga canis]
MKKHVFKALPTYNATDRVDAENGIIHGVVLAQAGVNKNGSYFSDTFLLAMEKQGNAKGEIKSRFGHPNMCTTALGTYIGDYKNFRVGNGKLYGDLHLSEISKKVNVPNGGVSMYDYVVEMAQTHPEKFGNSIVVYADEQEEEITNEKGEKKTVYSLILDKWVFSDLVDDPAATDSLFHDTADLGTKITEFLDDNPKIFEVLEQNPQIFADFFQRYEHYSARKHNFNHENMSILKTIRNLVGKKDTFDFDLTLANGDIVTVVTEAEEPQVGDPVKDSEGNPLPDGEHLLPDGKALVTNAGVISEIKEEEEPAPATEEKTKSDFQALYEQDKEDNAKAMLILAKAFDELKEKFDTLAKGVQSQYQVTEEGKQPAGTKQEKSVFASLEELREKRKKLKS